MIEIKTRLLREFLSAKNMELSLQFDFMRFSQDEVESLGLKETLERVCAADGVFQIQIVNRRNFSSNKGAQGWLLGKRTIKGKEDKKFRGTEEERFIEFLIGINSDCKEIQYTCKESELSNYFGANPGAPHYLTPVFFKKIVLNKYYAEPNKYTVTDGNLFCGGLWGLPIDNNHPDYIVVFLGDLGRLTYLEQMHWRAHNVAVQENISRTSFERNIKGVFFDPESVDLIFKQKIRFFKKKWIQKFQWSLFREMSPDDLHHFTTLRIPITNEQSEFDQQVLSLVKVLIDSLNEAELAKKITPKKGDRGINKLKAFFELNGTDFSEEIQFLRNLQELRSAGAAHLKGSNYEKCKIIFLIGNKDLSKIFKDILGETIKFIDKLEAKYIN